MPRTAPREHGDDDLRNAPYTEIKPEKPLKRGRKKGDAPVEAIAKMRERFPVAEREQRKRAAMDRLNARRRAKHRAEVPRLVVTPVADEDGDG